MASDPGPQHGVGTMTPAPLGPPSSATTLRPTRRRGAVVGPAVLAGLLIALSVPPLGWWPLGIAGLAVLGWRLRELPGKSRALGGLVAGTSLYLVTLWWMSYFNFIGALAAMVTEAMFLALAAVL